MPTSNPISHTGLPSQPENISSPSTIEQVTLKKGPA